MSIIAEMLTARVNTLCLLIAQVDVIVKVKSPVDLTAESWLK